MKHKLSALSQQYATALNRHLNQTTRPDSITARGLGFRAVAIGLETLDVARIHQHALASLEAASSKDGLLKRADIFFTEAITPIEQTHRAAFKASARLKRLSKVLSQRTQALAASNRRLKEGIARRRATQAALKKSAGYYRTLLDESLALQKHLKHLAHRILSAQEHKRQKLSHELQDEIAQTLLGINVRLLTVKEAAGHNAKRIGREIARTEGVVDLTVKTINRFAREYGKSHGP